MLELLERFEERENTAIEVIRALDRYLYKQENLLREYYFVLSVLCGLVFVLLVVLVASNIYWRK